MVCLVIAFMTKVTPLHSLPRYLDSGKDQELLQPHAPEEKLCLNVSRTVTCTLSTLPIHLFFATL